MAFSRVVDEMMDFYETSMNSYTDACLNVHQQMQDLMNSMLPGLSDYNGQQGNRLLSDWKKAVDNALVAMQTSRGKLLDEMKPEQLFKKNIEEMWRQLGLANLGETNTLKDRLEQLKAQIESFQKQNQISDIARQLESDGAFVVKEDLKPVEKAVADIKDTVDSIGDVENLRHTVTQLENDLGNYKDDIAHVKELVAQINPKLSALTAAIERLSHPAEQG